MGARANTARKRFSLSSMAFSAFLRGETSRNTRTAPAISPDGPGMGDALSSMAIWRPSLLLGACCSPSPRSGPSRSALVKGLSAVLRVASSTMRRSRRPGLRAASSVVQPVRRSAAALRKVMAPEASVDMTPSLMLARVVWSKSLAPGGLQFPILNPAGQLFPLPRGATDDDRGCDEKDKENDAADDATKRLAGQNAPERRRSLQQFAAPMMRRSCWRKFGSSP